MILPGMIRISELAASGPGDDPGANPFRVLVIIGDQWEDPMSYLVSRPGPLEEYSGNFNYPEMPGPVDFFHLMIMLKSWGIPFDVVRLDQQFLDRNMFLGMDGKPKYGTVIWDVNRSDKLLHPDYSIVRDMVENHGIGLIALADRIFPAEIQSVLGIKYKGSWESRTAMEVEGVHFLTRGLNPVFEANLGSPNYRKRHQVDVLQGTTTIVRQGDHPQSTCRVLESGSRTVWIGHDHNFMFRYPDIRTLLRRAITWTIGYNLYKTWGDQMIMIIDDPGTAQNAWLEHWHYGSLSEETIEKYLIKPLRENNAVLNINFVAGFVNDEKGYVEPTWTQQFVDEFGTRQDYVSSKRGYDKGVKLGVFGVMCHGLTHMQPDLTSDPGWYGAELDREKSEVGWYREFGDTRRHKEIPAAEQMWRMKTSSDWLIQQFGVPPLAFCAGGGGASISYENSTVRIAGRAGFGWLAWNRGYLGGDMVFAGWDFNGTSESPGYAQAPPNGHDFGIAKQPEAFATVFEKYPGKRFININEYIAYLHAKNSGSLLTGRDPLLDLTVDYDAHYCSFFDTNPSRWILEISDWAREKMGKDLSVTVDGKTVPLTRTPHEITVPAGIGEHHIKIGEKK
jgi:hypothetical protein